MARQLRGTRYLNAKNADLAKFIVEKLPYLDFHQTMDFYKSVVPTLDNNGKALLGCNDRYFLFTGLLGRKDGVHPWLFDRCRELEKNPDGYIDLWSRFHYKSSLITCAGIIQEILCNPEIKIVIFSVTKPISHAFLNQIRIEFESNQMLRAIYSDVIWNNPKKDAPKWSLVRGLVVKRKGNPKESTLEAHGLIDGQPTSRHFDLQVYDDVVTQDYLSADLIKKTTERWEMADNLGSHLGVRKWIAGTRYHHGDTYGIIIRRGSLKPRIYPATEDGTLNGKPVFLTPERWEEVKNTQRSTVSAQMLLNPTFGSDATFNPSWLRPYEVIPATMNVYIVCDPSKGNSARSDRTAIAVIGIDQGGNKYLLDGVRHRMKLSDRWIFLRNLYAKWSSHKGVQFVKVGYEQYGQQADLDVIQEYQDREKFYFPIEEVNTPRQGRHSKNDRIERLEPDIRRGIFYFPAIVYHADFSDVGGLATWRPWSSEDADRARERGSSDVKHSIGDVVYRPMPRGRLTKAQSTVDYDRVVTAIKHLDEDHKVYDLTQCFIDEYLDHPFAQHDDLLDAVSRIYDMEPAAPIKFDEAQLSGVGEDEFGFSLAGEVDVEGEMVDVYDS